MKTLDDLMAEHRKEIPNYQGKPEAPLGRYPERNDNHMRSWEEIDRERQERFRQWLGPELYGWLNDNDTGEF